MKTIKKAISGTGNGVDGEYLDNFIQALKDFEKLIRSIYKYYERKPHETFSRGFRLLNNWHDQYKIEVRPDEFPYHLCTGIYVYNMGWNEMQLVCVYPLRFRAPTFNGGTTDNMSVAITTNIHLGQDNMKKFLKNKMVPKALKTEILQQLKQYYEEEVRNHYERDMDYLKNEIKRRKIQSEEAIEQINTNEIEIPKLKERIDLIKNELKKDAK